MRAVDCQGFAGGMTLGIVQSGFQLVAKKEMTGGFGVPNCEANRHLLGDDWKAQVCPPEEWEPETAELIFGNPPCSGFSLLNSSKGGKARGPDSSINHCMHALVEFAARSHGVQVVAFESVAQAYSQGSELMRVLRAKMEAMTGERWDLTHVLQNNYSVGGCSIRRRYFFVIAKIPLGFERYPLHGVPLLEEAIGDLEGLQPTWEAQPYKRPATWWSRPKRREDNLVDGHVGRDSLHHRRLIEMLREFEWVPGEDTSKTARRYYKRHGTLPSLMVHQLPKLLANDFNMGFNQTVRWRYGKAARVLTGNALGQAIHPSEDRFLTHREAARIQGFPDDWLIRPLRGRRGLEETWGKGIPVEAGRWLGRQLKASLEGTPAPWTGDLIGERERIVDVREDYRRFSKER